MAAEPNGDWRAMVVTAAFLLAVVLQDRHSSHTRSKSSRSSGHSAPILPGSRSAIVATDTDTTGANTLPPSGIDPLTWPTDTSGISVEGTTEDALNSIKYLFAGLPESLAARLRPCKYVGLSGDFYKYGFRGIRSRPEGQNVVYIGGNGEGMANSEYAAKARLEHGFNKAKDRLLLFGMWAPFQPNFTSNTVVSIWNPCSTVTQVVPLALLSQYAGTEMRWDYSTHRRQLAYQSRMCAPAREELWVALATALRKTLNLTSYHLGTCTGVAPGAPTVSVGDRSNDRARSSERYARYNLALVAEHGLSELGYLSEKFWDAVIAGSIPIHFGSVESVIGDFLNRERAIMPPVDWPNNTRRTKIRYGAYYRKKKDRVPWKTYAALSRSSEQAMVAKVVELAGNEEKLIERRSRTILAFPEDQTLRRWCSHHPSVWPTHGDQMRLTLMEHAANLCEHQGQ